MRDHDDGRALAIDFLEQFHHAARHQRIEIAGRFVGHQQARRTGQRTRDRDALLLAARQFRRIVLHARSQADARQRFVDALLALGAVEAAIAQRNVDVVGDVQIGNQIEALEDETDLLVAQLRTRVVVHAFHVDAIEEEFAAGEFLEQSGDVEECGLARTRRPRHRHEFAFADVDREIAQRMRFHHVRAIDLGQMRHFQHCGNSSLDSFRFN